MSVQTLTIGKKRFVLLPEREYQKMQRELEREVVRPEVAEEAMAALRAYRKTGKAKDWEDLKKELGL